MRRSFALVVAASLAAAMPALAQSRVPSGSIGIRLLQAPTNRENDPRAHIYIVDHLHQGDVIKRNIEVTSGLNKPVRLELYAAGAAIAGGEFEFFEGRKADELSSWTTVTPSSVDLGPGKSATGQVTVAIPKSATDGERYAVVWAQARAASPSSGGVAEVNRVGIRMYISVGKGKEPSSDFRIESLTALRDKSGRPHVSASVRNIGGRALDLSGELELTNGPGGLRAGPFPVKLGTTLGIGETEPVDVILSPTIPAGPWTARLTLRSGLIEHAAAATITFPTRYGTAARAVPAVPVRGRTPLLFVAGGLLLMLLVLLALFFWKRRRREEQDDSHV